MQRDVMTRKIMTVQDGSSMDRDMMTYVFENMKERELTQVKELSEGTEMKLKQKDLEQGRVVELRYRCTKVSI